MKINDIFIVCFALFLLGSCAKENGEGSGLPDNISERLEKLSEVRTEAEKNDDLDSFLKCYDENAISMPEYQPTLQGISKIESFYKEIFQRQNVKAIQRSIEEIINLDSTVIEIGIFKKEYIDSKADSVLILNGKYWNIFDVKSDGELKLKGEVFGFFHHVGNPETFTVQSLDVESGQSQVYRDQEIPLELEAYNALVEKQVKTRDGASRSKFYTHDAKFMPFASPTVTGMDELKPYFKEYTSRGEITLDSVTVYTYHYENLGDYILEYSKFKVRWTTSDDSGRTEGKGIQLWKRQADKSLKIYRHIGTHNHIE